MMRSFRSRKTTANLSETGYYRLQHTCARGGSSGSEHDGVFNGSQPITHYTGLPTQDEID
jgi:hypothetical protein